MLCPPPAKDDVAKLATPELLSVPEPKTVDPSLNVTVPDASVIGEVTVAVKVTDWPATDGLTEVAIVVVVTALFTVRVVVCMAVL